MSYLRDLTTSPAWVRLRFVSNSTAAKATVLVPLIGYLIIFNEHVVKYLNLIKEFGINSSFGMSHRLILIYLGLCAISLGVIIYKWLCPNEVTHYGTAASYIQGDGPSLRGFVLNDIQKLVAEQPHYHEKLVELSSELERKGQTSRLREDDLERFRIENLHLHFDYLNNTYPAARGIVYWAYVVGFGLLAIPSLEIFYRVTTVLYRMVVGRIS